MSRRERRLLAITDQLQSLEIEQRRLEDELSYHRSLADDAARDAAVLDNPIERENAAITSSDVRRFERRAEKLTDRRQKLEARRAHLLEELG